MKKNNITQLMKRHYQTTFRRYGPTSAGVDWGKDSAKAKLRYEKMLALLNQKLKKPSLLDVGCGYGGLLQFARESKSDLNYTGIDLAENMIKWAKKNLKSAKFIKGDFLKRDFPGDFDYVICNGILTQKLTSSLLEMDEYAKIIIQKMFKLCRIGIAFNVMTNEVNFFAPNLYYKPPSEMLSYCLSQISKKIKIDHSYGLYEYTIYLYK